MLVLPASQSENKQQNPTPNEVKQPKKEKSKRKHSVCLSSPITKHISKMECSWLIHIPFPPSPLLEQHKIQLIVSPLWRCRRSSISKGALELSQQTPGCLQGFYLFGGNCRVSVPGGDLSELCKEPSARCPRCASTDTKLYSITLFQGSRHRN